MRCRVAVVAEHGESPRRLGPARQRGRGILVGAGHTRDSPKGRPCGAPDRGRIGPTATTACRNQMGRRWPCRRMRRSRLRPMSSASSTCRPIGFNGPGGVDVPDVDLFGQVPQDPERVRNAVVQRTRALVTKMRAGASDLSTLSCPTPKRASRAGYPQRLPRRLLKRPV